MLLVMLPVAWQAALQGLQPDSVCSGMSTAAGGLWLHRRCSSVEMSATQRSCFLFSPL